MKIAETKQQNKIRRQATEALLVYDLNTKMPMGQILDMSPVGMKLMTEEPVAVGRMYYCRIPLEKKVQGKSEVFLDAECRWCKHNPETGWYNSGYLLRFPSKKDAEIIKTVLHDWMQDHMSKHYSKYGLNRRKKKRFFEKLFGK
ncbi:MAG: PilZ domain-containing protein [Candidatus Zixiibacteriota bacterium]